MGVSRWFLTALAAGFHADVEDEAERLAIAGADPVDHDQLRARLAAMNARGHRVPRVDPRSDAARLAEARRELDQARPAATPERATSDLSMEVTDDH